MALDATVCRMVGLDIDKVDYFEAAQERGLGKVSESDIEIRGRTVEEVKKQLYLPYLDGFDAWPEYNFHTEHACSTCQGLLAFTMVKMKTLGEYDKHEGLDIVIGRKKELPEGVRAGDDLILMGDCLKGLKKKIGGECLFVPGCPPVEAFPYWTIVDREEQPGANATREHHEAEERLFKEKLYGGK